MTVRLAPMQRGPSNDEGEANLEKLIILAMPMTIATRMTQMGTAMRMRMTAVMPTRTAMRMRTAMQMRMIILMTTLALIEIAMQIIMATPKM